MAVVTAILGFLIGILSSNIKIIYKWKEKTQEKKDVVQWGNTIVIRPYVGRLKNCPFKYTKEGSRYQYCGYNGNLHEFCATDETETSCNYFSEKEDEI